MADSAKAIDHILKIEGGYVDHPSDPGGATNYGITQTTLNRWHRLQGTLGFPVVHLTMFQARTIYKDFYWDEMNLDDTENEILALLVFDQGVNQGVRQAVERLQASINFTVRGVKLRVDGMLGPKTLRAMDQAKRFTSIDYIMRSQMFYASLVERRPDMAAFIRGWIKRTHLLFLEVES